MNTTDSQVRAYHRRKMERRCVGFAPGGHTPDPRILEATIIKIISGGQTGADQGGLEAGRELGLKTGGTAPLGWKTERGPMKELLQSYGLVEGGVPGYPFRTKMNVLNSDATVIFGQLEGSRGSSLTLSLCRQYKKPCLINPNTAELLELIETFNVKTLNVAGNRESKSPGIQKRVKESLVQSLSEIVTARPKVR